MKKLKIGVIGCGSIARQRHLPEYAAHSQAEITSVCDIVLERSREVAEQYGAVPFTRYEDLLASDVDAVSVCTPNYLHAPVTLAALNAGKHVLCEKPMATTKDDALSMMEAAEKNGKKLMIAHNQRFVRSHVKAKQLLEKGEIGRIYSFRTTFGHAGPENWSIDGGDSWFFHKHEASFGALGDLGVHKADLIRFLLGEEVVEVAAFVETLAKSHATVDDNAVCILKTESGIVGSLAASWSYVSEEDNTTMIYGEKAILRLEDDPNHALVVQYHNGEVVKYALGNIQSNTADGQTQSHVVDAFVRCIVNDTPPPVSGREGLRALHIILAALESNEKKRVIRLDYSS